MSRSSRPFRRMNLLSPILIFGALLLFAAPVAAEQIARTVGTSSDFAVVASFDAESGAGEARLLDRDGVTGALEERQVLLEGSSLGRSYSVSIDRGDALVGDPNEGVVHLFRCDQETGAWAEAETWTVDDGKRDRFGSWIHLADDHALVGAPEAGRVYVFRRGDDRWRETLHFEEGDSEAWSDHTRARAFFDCMIAGAGGGAAKTAECESLFVVASDSLFENRVEVRWPSSPGAIYFELRRDSLVPGDGPVLTYEAGTESLFVDTHGHPGYEYTYVLVRHDPGGVCGDTDSDEGSRRINPPGSLAASDGEYEDRIRLSWIDGSGVETGFYVYRDGLPIDTLGANRTSYDDTDTTVTAPTGHEYCVTAFDAADFESRAVCDPGHVGHIVPPLEMSASDGQYPDYVRITWRDQSEREMRYDILRDTSPIGWTDAIPGDTATVIYHDLTADPAWVYEYCVISVDSFSNLSSAVCDLGGRWVLPAPTNVAASNGEFDDKVRVTWSDPSGTEDGFHIYRRKLSETDSTLIDSTSANTTSYDDFTADPDTLYRYCVAAFADSGGVSAAVCADDGRRAVVLPPTFVQATDVEHEDHVSISWECPSAEVSMFKLYRNGTIFLTAAGFERTANDTAIESGVEYEYCVSAVTSQGYESPLSCDIAGSRRLLPPTAVEASDHTYEDEVRITWVDHSSAEDGYRIYHRPASASIDTLIGTRTPNRTVYVDRTGVPGVDYVYSVVAYDQYSENPSDIGESEAVSDNGGRTLKPPAGLVATQGEFENRIDLSWEDSSRAETGYSIYRIETDSLHLEPDSIGSTAADARAFIDSVAIIFGANYTYLVVAHDSLGQSAADTASGYTTILPPGSFHASDTYDSMVVLTWTDESEIETGYEISRNDSVLDTTAANMTSYTDSMAPGNTFAYCVVSIGGASRSLTVCDSGIAPVTTPPADLSHGIHMEEALMARNGAAEDHFGRSVAAYGDYVAVGASDSTRRDSVHIYQHLNNEWQFQATISGGSGWNVFGRCLAMDGDLLAVGDDSAAVGGGRGVVSIHQRAGDSYDWVNYLTGTIFSNSAGYSVSIRDGWVIYGDPGGTYNEQCYVYICRWDAQFGGWEYKLFPGSVNDRFGHSVATDGQRAVAGEPLGHDSTGGVHVFERGDSTYQSWSRTDTLFASDRSAEDEFGAAVAVDGDFIIVGAPGADIDTLSDAGAVYVFEWSGASWIERAKLISSEIDDSLSFGSSIALQGDLLVVGSPGSGAEGDRPGCSHVFQRSGENWRMLARLLSLSGEGSDQAGRSVALSDGAIIMGAPYDDNANGIDAGSAHIFERVCTPESVTASDGSLADRVRVSWQGRGFAADGFRVYRDADLTGPPVGSNIFSIDDFDAIPGRSYEYKVVEYNEHIADISEALGVSAPSVDFGRRPPDGSIGGRVISRGGAGIDSARVCLDPSPNTAILLDGERGHVLVDSLDIPDLTEFTVEFWNRNSVFEPMDPENRWLFSYGDSALGQIEIYKNMSLGGGVFIRFEVTEFGAPIVSISNDGEWHHLAFSYQIEGDLCIWEDGEEIFSIPNIPATGPIAGGRLLVLGQNRNDLGHSGFLGEMDEVRLWNRAFTEDEIREQMYSTLTGDEENLVGYWPLDQEGGTIVADMSPRANYGRLVGGVFWADDAAPLDVCALTDREGNYTLSDIRYGTSREFVVTPHLEPRDFQPDFKRITLNEDSPVQNEVDFTDITAYTVAGRIIYEGTECPVPNVPINVNGLVKGSTGEDGTYSLALEAGEYVIEPDLEGHAIEPASRTINVAGNRSDVHFTDPTTRSVSGRIGGGGRDCARPVGDIILETRSTETACFVRTDTIPGADSAYAFALPPMKYSIEALDVLNVPDQLDRVDVLRFFERLGEREIDLTEADTTLAFVYRAPLRVTIEGFPGPECPEIGVPIIAQLDRVPLMISVEEDYGAGGTCPLDSGFVVIYDEIIDEAEFPETVTVENGIARYTTAANTPNVYPGRLDAAGNDRSYQKKITVRASVKGGEPTEKSEWVVVTGHKARTGTFVTGQSEPILAYVLRDPPGDASSAYLEEGTTITNRWGSLWFGNEEGGYTLEGRKGIAFSKGTLGFETDTEMGVIAGLRVALGHKWENGTIFRNTVEFVDRLSTSSGDEFVGDDSDVYIGYAMNLIFAETDQIDIEDCGIVKSTGLAVDIDTSDTFPTEFAFTGAHIQSALIPQLERLRDSLDTDNAVYYQNNVDNWNDMLEKNRTEKENAQFEENRSFSGGADYTFSHTVVDDTTDSDIVTFYGDFDPYFGWLAYESGSGAHHNFFISVRLGHTDVDESTDAESHTVGYTLSDNDIGDYFSVDVMRDEGAGGGPIFNLRSGRSACPWEVGTQPRDGSILYVDPLVQSGVMPDEPATFVLTMVNASESDERREYMIVPDLASNPGGAVLRLNGDPFSEGTEGNLFILEPGESYEATLTVERGPTRYSYPNLGITMVPTCEYERYRRGLPYLDLQRAANATVSVDFEAPCSDITLFEPEDHWSHNAGDGDTLLITLADFELAVSLRDTVLLSSVGAEYRPAGTDEDWDNIGTAVVAEIDTNPDGSPQSVEIPWFIGIVPDGDYEVRAFTTCENAMERVYSLTATGAIDREAPRPLGTPEPADRLLTVGDDISIEFNEAILCPSIDLDSVRLTVVDPDIPDDTLVTISTACDGRTIMITPTAYGERTGLDSLEGKILRMRVSGITDLVGNPMAGTDGSSIESWEFEYRKSSFTWAEAGLLEDVPFRSPATIVASLVNGGSEDSDFEINDLPDWLGAYPGSGMIRAGETIDISFLVSDTLSPGIHLDVVIAVARDMTSGTIVAQSPLRIRADVACRAPEWAFDPGDYQYTMTVIAEGSAEGDPLDSTADLVAAYVGNEIRGVASPILVESLDRYYFFLTVHSNRMSGETVRFQAWGADSCRNYGASDRSIPFVADTLYGTVDSPELIAFSESPPEVAEAIELRNGWTWFSLQMGEDEKVSIVDVLADLTPFDGDLIKSRTEYAQFFGGDSGWVGDLDTLDRVSTYMIRLTGGGTIYHKSLDPPGSAVPIPVIDGWNWISYIPDVEYPVNEAFVNLVASTNDVVKSQFGFAEFVDTSAVAGSGEWIGNLGTLAPGGGYKLFLSDAAGTGYQFLYPGGVATGIPGEPPAYEGADAGPNWALTPRGFQHTMTVTASVEFGDDRVVSEEDIIAAFVDGEVRGVTRPQQITALDRQLTFLVIHSDRYIGEEVAFQVYDADRKKTLDVVGALPFEANKIVGTVREPYLMKTTGVEESEGNGGIPHVFQLSQNIPNPFNPRTVIRYGLPTQEHVVLRFYNVAGRLVSTLVNEKRPAGWHQLVVDADRWASGVYFYRIEAGPYSEVHKMTLLK